ncbi:MAG: NUDIX domain-containing protein [Candidatus Paceibacterota bacterium]
MGYKKYRKGIFCVIYALERGKPVYLLLRRTWHWKGWEFCKGGMKKGEKYEKCALREVREETGLKILKLERFKTKGKFEYDSKTQAERKAKGFSYVLFSGLADKGKVKISRKEHDRYKWCDYKEALKLLSWSDKKRCLKIVNDKLKR